METFQAPKRPHIALNGPERVQLDAWLDIYRATLLEKCDGLNAAQMKERPVASSRLSLLGIVRHMTFVEQIWFENRSAGRETSGYYKTEGDRDADFNDLDDTAVENVFVLYGQMIDVARELAAGHDLDERARTVRRGRDVDLRWIFVHMIEEYARHCGHADLIKELIDRATGYRKNQK